MAKKEGKTVYIPIWIHEILDKEGKIHGGPGVVAAASIFNFSQKKRNEKKKILQEYRINEVAADFAEPQPKSSGLDEFGRAVQADLKRKPHKRYHEDPKAG